MKKLLSLASLVLLCTCVRAQADTTGGNTIGYKKRVLEAAELQLLTSYYSQDGDFAAVSGGTGSEELTDVHPTVIMTLPLNADDVLTVNTSVSSYSSASSSNVDPFDGGGRASPFQASSGASKADNWINASATYSHSSDDRNRIWTATLSGSNEYDYTSLGVGGSYTRQMNQNNTSLSLKGNVFIDGWKTIYPIELRPFENGGTGLDDRLFQRYTITGNTDYRPDFLTFSETGRNSYNLGLTLTQLFTPSLEGLFSADYVLQQGLLSTPFQRVYFADVENAFIEDFPLADDIERLPDSRNKLALGGRLHAYLSERFVLRTFYRYYSDDWGIRAHTLNLEVPVKVSEKFTLRPAYRYYVQEASTYFAPFDTHLSSETFYTSDYDLSGFQANQYSMGVSYTDIFTSARLLNWGLKSVDLNFSSYSRDNGFSAFQLVGGVKFVHD